VTTEVVTSSDYGGLNAVTPDQTEGAQDRYEEIAREFTHHTRKFFCVIATMSRCGLQCSSKQGRAIKIIF
jgi:hypothetical protein